MEVVSCFSKEQICLNFPQSKDLLTEIIEGQCLSFVKSAHDYADLIQSV
jgi:hypothetical protein